MNDSLGIEKLLIRARRALRPNDLNRRDLFGRILNGLSRYEQSEHQHWSVVQIGANDGVTNDPVCRWIHQTSFPVVMVEPQPDVFSKLCRNYADRGEVQFINAAICDKRQNIPMYRIALAYLDEYRTAYKRSANASGVTSMDRDHVRQHLSKVLPADVLKRNTIDDWIEQIDVRGMPFDDLIQLVRIDNICLLQIDAEGKDAEIVTMALESKAGAGLPLIVNFEHSHLEDHEYTQIVNKLLEAGYSILRHRSDTCAFRCIML